MRSLTDTESLPGGRKCPEKDHLASGPFTRAAGLSMTPDEKKIYKREKRE